MFFMDVDTAAEFFRRVSELKVDTFEERMRVMDDLLKEKKVMRVTPNVVKKMLNGKKVLVVKKENSGDAPDPKEDF